MKSDSLKINVSSFLDELLEWIFAIVITLEVNSVFFTAASRNYHISEVICGVTGLMAVIVFLRNKNISRRVLMFICIYEVLAMFFLAKAVSNASIVSFSIKFLLFFPLMVFIYSEDQEKFNKLIYKGMKVVVVLAFLSLIAYAFGVILKIIPPSGTFRINWGGGKTRTVYLFVLYAGQFQSLFGMRIIKNTGVYSEAPMYGFVLIMAFATRLFLCKEKRKFDAVVLFLTIISTISIAAIICALVLLFIKFILSSDKNSVIRNNLIKGFIAIIVLGVSLYIIRMLIDIKKNTGYSYSVRLDDYKAGFQAWLDHPIFGLGYGNFKEIIQYMKHSRQHDASVGYSNAIMYILASCGIYGLSLYIVSFARSFRFCSKSKDWGLFAVFAVMAAMLFTTIVPMHLFTLNYVAVGMVLGFRKIDANDKQLAAVAAENQDNESLESDNENEQ